MKKTMAMAVALLFLLGFTSFTFAKGSEHKPSKAAEVKTEIIKGKVVSVDTANKAITVTDDKTQQNRTFAVLGEKAIAQIKKVSPGDEVRVRVKSGTDQAMSVKKVESEEKGEKTERKGDK
jgi:hypothetical protein